MASSSLLDFDFSSSFSFFTSLDFSVFFLSSCLVFSDFAGESFCTAALLFRFFAVVLSFCEGVCFPVSFCDGVALLSFVAACLAASSFSDLRVVGVETVSSLPLVALRPFRGLSESRSDSSFTAAASFYKSVNSISRILYQKVQTQTLSTNL